MKQASTLTLALAILLLPAQNAYAYLDPGTGSIILQALIGGIAGGLLFIKIYWARTKSYFQGLLKTSPPEDQDDLTSTNQKQTPNDKEAN